MPPNRWQYNLYNKGVFLVSTETFGMNFSFWLPTDKRNMGAFVLKSGTIGKHSGVHRFLIGLLSVLLNAITVLFLGHVILTNQDLKVRLEWFQMIIDT